MAEVGRIARRILGVVVRTGAILTIAVFLTAERGPTLLDPFFLIPFSCLAVFLAGPIAVRRRVVLAVLESCGSMAAILFVSVWLVRLTASNGMTVTPSGSILFDAAAVAISATTAAALLAKRLLARFPARYVTWGFRVCAVACLAAYRWFPQSWSNGVLEAVLAHGLTWTSLSLTAGFIGAAVILTRLPSAPITRPLAAADH